MFKQSKLPLIFFRALPLSCCVLAVSPNAQAATYTVGSGQNFETPEQIQWSTIHAGDTISILPGTYTTQMNTGNSMIVSGVVGTAANPVTIQGSSATNLPKLNAGLLISGSQYVTITNLDISRSIAQQYAAVVLEGNSSHIVMSGLNVHDSYVGVQFTQPGLENILQNSQVYNSVMMGVGAGPPNTSVVPDNAHRSFLSYNNIHDNGSHGIEVTGPYWNVLHNHVTHNGLSTHGTSGVHMYSTTDVNGMYACNNALVVYNFVSAQQDTGGVDGNGIQIDDFCDNNTVAFNVVWGNAGAGISVLDAQNNLIVANTSYSDETDTQRLATYPTLYRGEIMLNSMASLCSNPNVVGALCNVASGQSSGNVVYDNLVVSGQTSVPGIFVSPDAAVKNTNHLYPNLYYNLGSASTGVQLSWNGALYYSGSTIDSVTGMSQRGGGNLVEQPSFLNAAAPATGGLALTKKPWNEGWVINPTVPDTAGVMPTSGISYYGAYYTSP